MNALNTMDIVNNFAMTPRIPFSVPVVQGTWFTLKSIIFALVCPFLRSHCSAIQATKSSMILGFKMFKLL